MSEIITEPEQGPGNEARRRWMAVLARASRAELEAEWSDLPRPPSYEWLRRPEVGLVMVRGRAGGTGQAFNLGEMAVTRCALRLADAAFGAVATGHAYVKGRDRRHAELAAAFDALLQTPDGRGPAQEAVRRLADRRAAEREQRSRKANATRVEFFTMVRGENPR
ncbi:phosphonate C-P lyase system protein PhnG [Arenibaculum pallidiluteum]|uniref:phosphonate C-P lyase system protein PhnG n=1 Tax=Arenibaculum pallidiluteum TaxID=2812559 RepID=UPI001A9617F3|nr:phosphonate C-P lyase system protein PhnG [Arenibaculum pallidiluteum]